MNIQMMRARVDEIDSELRTIDTEAGESRLDETQQVRWDELDTEKAELARQIAEAEAAEQRAERVAESRARWSSVQVSPTKPTDAFDLAGLRGASGDEMIDQAMRAIEGAQYGRLRVSEEARAGAIEKIETLGEDVARHAIVHGSPAYMSAFRSWVASGGAPIYTAEEAAAVRAAMSLTSANGGYVLPTLLDPTLIPTGTVTKNPVRRLSRQETGTVNTWNGVTVGNVTTAWKAEGAAFTAGEPTLGAVSIDAHMLTAYLTASFEIFGDSNLQSQLPGLIGQAIDMEEAVQFVTGTGSTTPYGVVGQISGTAGSLVTVTTRGQFDSTSGADTLALFAAVPERYDDAATLVANKATLTTIAKQTIGTTGVMLADLAVNQQVLGSPTAKASSITGTTTSGNILAVLGDFSQFIIYDRIGVSLEFVQNVVDGSGIPTGQRGLLAYKRVGAKAADVNAFRLLKA